MKNSAEQPAATPSQLIDARIRQLADWRGEMLGRLRSLLNCPNGRLAADQHRSSVRATEQNQALA